MADIKELTVGGTTYKIKDEVCRTNIWSVQNKVGKNLLNFKAWSEAVPVNKGTKTVSDNAITLTATDNDCYTKYGASEYPQDVRIKVNPGDVLTLSWDYSAGSSQSDDKVYIFGYNETEPPLSNANVSSQTGYLQYTVPANAKFCTFRLGVTTSGNTATYSNIMICDKAVYDQDSSFQPYGAPNYDLTYREAEDRAALVPVIDKGAKNLFDWKNSEVKTYNPYHATVSKTESSFTITSANVSAAYGFVLSLPKGDYVLTTTISNFSGSNSCWCVIAVGEPYSLSNVVNQYTFNDNCNIELNFTLTQTSNVYVMYYANKVGTSYIDTTSFTASNLMICTEEEFKISPAHAPFTLPNYDLTVREAEDRAALAEQVDEGAKNILDEWNEILKNRSTSGNSVTVHGITYTNTNGTITMSGTADNPSDNAATLFLLVDTMKLSNGSYVISWRSKSISNVQTNIKYLNMVEAIQSTDSVIELPSNRTDSASMWISIPNGTTVSGSIDIMICTLADWKISQNYAPFALPNTDLTVLEAEDRAALADVVDSGAKNLLSIRLDRIKALNTQGSWNGNVFTHPDGVTFTINSDMTISTSGTANELLALVIYDGFNTSFNIETTLSGCPNGGDYDTKYSIYMADSQGVKMLSTADSNGVTVPTSTVFRYVLILIRKGVNASGLTFKPMICEKAAWGVSHNYVPFRESTPGLITFTPSAAGWYRLYELGTVSGATTQGASDNSCNIVIKREYNNNNNEHHEIKLAAIFTPNIEFTNEFSKSSAHYITRIRYVTTSTNAYIDVYYSGSLANDVWVFLTNNVGHFPWKPMSFIYSVPETTTGETVVTSYSFKDNFNIFNKTPKFISSGSVNSLNDTNTYYVGADVADKPTTGWGFVRCTAFDANTILQEFFSVESPYNSYNRVRVTGTWQTWNQINNA